MQIFMKFIVLNKMSNKNMQKCSKLSFGVVFCFEFIISYLL